MEAHPQLGRLPSRDPSGVKVAGAGKQSLAATVKASVNIVDDAIGPQMVQDPGSGQLLPFDEAQRREQLRQQFGLGG